MAQPETETQIKLPEPEPPTTPESGRRHKTDAPPPLSPHRYFGSIPPRLPPITANALGEKTDWDPRLAYLTSVVSAWAYADKPTMERQLPYFGLDGCTVDEFTVTNDAMLVVAAAYLVLSQDRSVGVLVFRGTKPDDLINWLTDANTALTKFRFGRVHAGFYDNVQPLWGELVTAVDAAVKGGMKALLITGHSLGAAMAVIAAARLASPEYSAWQSLVRGVYTFGQPSVGDRTFVDHYEKVLPLYRHVYRNDVVPHLPPLDVGAFPHFGTEFYSDGTAGWDAMDPPRTVQAKGILAAIFVTGVSFLARRLTILRSLKLQYSIEDHGPLGYVKASRGSL